MGFKTFVEKAYRKITSNNRKLPSFIVFGAQRCGTTSFYNNICEHPGIEPAWIKEINYFDRNYGNINWYKSFFPINNLKKSITGEASIGYIFYPHAPKRIFQTLPNVRLIVMLRNPIHRAYSNYYWEVKHGREKASFDDALRDEGKLINGEMQKMIDDANYYSYNFLYKSYLTKGIYVDQLKRWFDVFPKEQILVLRSEDFFSEPQKILHEVFDFLDLPSFSPSNLKKKNVGSYLEMKKETKDFLESFYTPHNERLYKLLGRDFNWN